MSWLQLKLAIPETEAVRCEAELEGLGALSVTLQDAADEPIFEPAPGEVPLWRMLIITALFDSSADMEAIHSVLRKALGDDAAENAHIEILEDRDWTREWMRDFKPMCFGKRLWVCPTGFDPPVPEAVNLRLDPGLAFGTGTHPTTRLCLRWLDGARLQGNLVVDYGCGSGILAVAAAKLGARRVVAVDNDPQALSATVENALRNELASCLTHCAPDTKESREPCVEVCLPDAVPDVKADTVLANILAGPLVELAPRLAALVRPGGDIVLSGILREQEAEVRAAYAPLFAMDAAEIDEDWVRLSGRRLTTAQETD